MWSSLLLPKLNILARYQFETILSLGALQNLQAIDGLMLYV